MSKMSKDSGNGEVYLEIESQSPHHTENVNAKNLKNMEFVILKNELDL